MTDRDRFTLHILPGMPATREGAMRGPRITVPSIEALGKLGNPREDFIYFYWYRPEVSTGPDNSGAPITPPKLEARRSTSVHWNESTAEKEAWVAVRTFSTTPPKRKKRKRAVGL